MSYIYRITNAITEIYTSHAIENLTLNHLLILLEMITADMVTQLRGQEEIHTCQK